MLTGDAHRVRLGAGSGHTVHVAADNTADGGDLLIYFLDRGLNILAGPGIFFDTYDFDDDRACSFDPPNTPLKDDAAGCPDRSYDVPAGNDVLLVVLSAFAAHGDTAGYKLSIQVDGEPAEVTESVDGVVVLDNRE